MVDQLKIGFKRKNDQTLTLIKANEKNNLILYLYQKYCLLIFISKIFHDIIDH